MSDHRIVMLVSMGIIDAAFDLSDGLLFIILAGVPFFIHWRWLKGITSAPATP